VTLTADERHALDTWVRRHTTAHQLAVRARLILAAAAGHNNAQMARRVGVDVDPVRLWRPRWLSFHTVSLEDLRVAERWADAPRPGHPARITADQVGHIVALACEAPSGAGWPISQWSSREIAEESRPRGIVEQLSPRHAARLLNTTIGNRP
jgi:putative transposase